MIYGFTVTFSGLADFQHTKARFASLVSRALGSGLVWWHRQSVPGHFRRGADRKYDYAKRKPRIRDNGERIPAEEMKRIKVGHTDPLTMKGRLRRDVSRTIDIRTSSRLPKVRGRMHGPGYLHPAGRPGRTPSGGKAPDIGGEIVTITPPELAAILRVVKKHLLANLDYLRPRRRRVRIG